MCSSIRCGCCCSQDLEARTRHWCLSRGSSKAGRSLLSRPFKQKRLDLNEPSNVISTSRDLQNPVRLTLRSYHVTLASKRLRSRLHDSPVRMSTCTRCIYNLRTHCPSEVDPFVHTTVRVSHLFSEQRVQTLFHLMFLCRVRCLILARVTK